MYDKSENAVLMAELFRCVFLGHQKFSPETCSHVVCYGKTNPLQGKTDGWKNFLWPKNTKNRKFGQYCFFEFYHKSVHYFLHNTKRKQKTQSTWNAYSKIARRFQRLTDII